MDSAVHSHAASTSATDENSKIAIPSKRELFLSTYQPHQIWSIPDSIIYYILKNPSSSKVYQKLIQSCKYFFIKNSILVVPWKTLLNEKCVDLQTVSSKLWVSGELSIGDYSAANGKYFVSTILSKIYQCDAKYIFLYHQIITFNDLLFLGSKAEEILLWSVTVKNDDGTVVSLEKIVAALPNVKDVFYDLKKTSPNIITSKTAKNLIKIPRFAKLKYFKLFDIPESFDIDTFYAYFKKNMKTQIRLNFVQNISVQYRNRLEAIVNEIIQTENRYYLPPYIYFDGIEESSRKKLWNLYRCI